MATETPLQPQLGDELGGEALTPAGRFGQRGLAYALLRAARAGGKPGVTHREFAEAGVGSAPVHIESLRFEGHRINALRGDDPHRPITLFVLTHDAWEDR